MAQTRPCDVSPQSDQDKYSIALMKDSGEWIGLDVPLYQIFPSTNDAPPPLERVSINSFHAGRGFDRFVEKQYGFYDAYNGWSTTPGKYHATQLQRWARGLRTADFSMPDLNGVTWKPLVGTTRFLDVSFVASENYTAARLILILRKQVPAGTVSAPGTLTVQLCNDVGGNPDSVITTVTLTASGLSDVISQYYVFTISAVLAVSTTYHIKIYGATSDRNNACWEIGCNPSAAGLRSTNGSAWTATTFSPYYRVTNADPACQYKPFEFRTATYLVSIYDNHSTASRLFLNGNRGRATGAQTASTLQDTSHGAYGATAWPTNRFTNSYIRLIGNSSAAGQVRQIVSNTGDTYTVSPNWDVTPVSGETEYVVYSCDWFVEIAGTGLGAVTGRPVVQNSIVYFPQGDSVDILRMRLNYGDADVHEFASEATKHNRAHFLEAGFESSLNEPLIWRGNQLDTSGGAPNGKASSVSYASTAPGGIALAWGTDLTFNDPVLTGENTNRITNLHDHESALYAPKEDGLFLVQGKRAVRVRFGIETSPDVDNGRAVVTAGDKNLYMAFRNDVYLIAQGGGYNTNLKSNFPWDRAGVISDLIAAEGWVFAAVDARVVSFAQASAANPSSVMKYSLDTKTWSEQLRAFAPGYRIRNLHWQPCPEIRPRLWIDIGGDLMYQEFPVDGVRPCNDKGSKYQHETALTLPTVDLSTTDPKYFAVLTVTSQGLAQETDAESGHVIVVECQTDNDIGTNNWEHVDYIKISPTASVSMDRGNKRMIRPRLRLISNEVSDPVIVEVISLTLFARKQLAHEWPMQFPLLTDDEEQNSSDVLMWLREAAQEAAPLTMYSRFTLFHDRKVTLADEPRYQITELDAPNNELEAQIWMRLTEVV